MRYISPNPDRFDIDRPAEKLASFGHGPHFCIGSYIARIALEVIFDRLAELELAGDEPQWIESFIVRGPLSVPVSFVAH